VSSGFGILLCCIEFAAQLTEGSEGQSVRSLCCVSARTGVKAHAASGCSRASGSARRIER
jgi:hypothetical protein